MVKCFLVNFAKFVRIPLFAELHQMTASDYSSINSSEGRIGKRNCELKKNKLKHRYIFEPKVYSAKRKVQVKEHASDKVVRRCTSKYIFF